MKTHFSFKHLLFIGGAVLYSMQISAVKNPVDYVSTLVGTQSKFELSTGNTYPATALPWGMNFWTPQTGKMGDGWAYTYNADVYPTMVVLQCLHATLSFQRILCPLQQWRKQPFLFPIHHYSLFLVYYCIIMVKKEKDFG